MSLLAGALAWEGEGRQGLRSSRAAQLGKLLLSTQDPQQHRNPSQVALGEVESSRSRDKSHPEWA